MEKYGAKADPEQPQHHATYAAMIESLDESVGRLMRALREWQIDDRTLVVFTSDNGGLTLNQITSNVPLRAGKGSAYEGGVRVPLIFRCPGTVAVGTSDMPAMSIDLLPTLVELSGVSSGRDTTIDGMSLASQLRGAGPVARDALYWHYPHYHPGGATPYGAVRSGDWKLIEFYEDQHIELYNLREDLSEERDRAAELPEKAAALRPQLHQWREQVGAQMPTAG